MGHKKLLDAYQIFTAGVMTGTNVLTSAPISIKNVDNVGFQIAWTGTPTGVLAIQASIDGVSYFTITPSPVLSQPAGSASSELTSLNQLPYMWLQLKYTNASGVGALNVWVCAKDLN